MKDALSPSPTYEWNGEIDTEPEMIGDGEEEENPPNKSSPQSPPHPITTTNLRSVNDQSTPPTPSPSREERRARFRRNSTSKTPTKTPVRNVFSPASVQPFRSEYVMSGSPGVSYDIG